MSMDKANGECTVEHLPKEALISPPARADTTMKNSYTIYRNTDYTPPWEQHIHYNAAPAPYVTTPKDLS
uniref:Uncharacterized protein n=1 Tax=Romanomermis culicivorax TaxID=13658 RepID=A0A915KK62_ROMCU